MKLKNVFKSKHQKFYTGIDELPLFNWIKCTNGDLRFVRIDSKSITATNENDVDAWNKIYDDYIKEFGLSEMYIKMLNVMRKKAMLEIDFVINRDRFKLTEIEIELSKLEMMMANNGKGITIEQSLVHLSKWMGHWINSKNIITKDYFNLLNEYGKANTK